MTREIAFDSSWKDKLTAYNGTAISYDAIGNPLNDGAWGYTWEKGRQLKRMSRSGVTVDFAYNADGLRIQKTVNGTTTDYILHGKNVVHLTQGSNSLHFFYDAQNRPAVVEWNNGSTVTRYAYILNLQGDVLGLRDSTGTEVVKYAYDAWGKILSTTGSLAATLGKLNPFRYRGYVYDEETGLYYLRSRYYNPEWGRFVNADGVYDGNLFNYCKNSPITQADFDGEMSEAIIDHCVLTRADTGAGSGGGGSIIVSWGFLQSVVDWISVGLLGLVAIPQSSVVVAAQTYDPDPYARPGQKKQNRENKSKSRLSDNWQPNPNKKPKPPKKHTPGRDHRKYKGILFFVLNPDWASEEFEEIERE